MFLDTVAIICITLFLVFPALQQLFIAPMDTLYAMNYGHHYIPNTLVMACFITWCTYSILFTISPLCATPGQLALNIYVCNVFGETLTLIAATGRFVIFSSSLLVSLAYGIEDLLLLYPLYDWAPLDAQATIHPFFYTIMLMGLLVQTILLWPLLTSNHRFIIWDNLFRTCVLQRSPRV